MGSEVHPCEEVLTGQYCDGQPIAGVDHGQRTQVEVSEHLQHFGKLVRRATREGLLDHVRAQVHLLVTELFTELLDFGKVMLRGQEVDVEEVPGQDHSADRQSDVVLVGGVFLNGDRESPLIAFGKPRFDCLSEVDFVVCRLFLVGEIG